MEKYDYSQQYRASLQVQPETDVNHCLPIKKSKNVKKVKQVNSKRVVKSKLISDFHCDKCNKAFSTKSSFEKHNELHNMKRKFVCGTCDLRFASKDVLRNHKQRMHLGLKNEKCKYCNKSYSDIYLKLHIQSVHLKEYHYFCDFCLKGYPEKFVLKKHIKYFHIFPNKRQSLKPKNQLCTVCDSKFTIKRDLVRHIQSVHLKIRNYECSTCSKKFYMERDLKIHVSNVHLKIKPTVLNHKKTKNSTKIKQKMNHSVRTIKNSKSDLKDGTRIKSSSKCGTYNKNYSSRISFKTHLKSAHQNVRSFLCKLCENNEFSVEQDVIRHLICVHKVKKDDCINYMLKF